MVKEEKCLMKKDNIYISIQNEDFNENRKRKNQTNNKCRKRKNSVNKKIIWKSKSLIHR